MTDKDEKALFERLEKLMIEHGNKDIDETLSPRSEEEVDELIDVILGD